MHLSTILKEYGLNPDEVKLTRHPLSNKEVKKIYATNKNYLFDYQSIQPNNIFDNVNYVITFVGIEGCKAARFIGALKVIGRSDGGNHKDMMPSDYPYPDQFLDEYYYKMEKTDIMSDLENRLVIDWPSPLSWCQNGTTDKKVIAIYSDEIVPFVGYENVILNFEELLNIATNSDMYVKWQDALSEVNGIYLICDIKNNKQYIGSTYNSDGILGRWMNYIKDPYTGDNVEISTHIQQFPDAYKSFQFSILKILPKDISQVEAIRIENLYKKKLNTRNSVYGLNRN